MHYRALRGILLLLLVPGCAGIAPEATEKVVINTYPTDARIIIDGRSAGRSPLTIELPRTHSASIRIEHERYRPVTLMVSPQRNERGIYYPRFGMLEDGGFYHDLVPNPVEILMTPVVVPKSKSSDPFEDFKERVAIVDAMLKRGEIGPAEHAYIVQCLTEFYDT